MPCRPPALSSSLSAVGNTGGKHSQPWGMCGKVGIDSSVLTVLLRGTTLPFSFLRHLGPTSYLQLSWDIFCKRP